MSLTQTNLSYSSISFQKKYKNLDIINIDYLYKFIDMLLKTELTNFKKNNKKPFTLSRNRHTIVIQYPSTYDVNDYDVWYNTIEQKINKCFYRKESDNSDIPDAYQRNRLFTTFDSKEYEINGNVVIKSVPIFKPIKKKKTTTVSNENKEAINAINNSSDKIIKTKCMYYADDSDDDSDE
jgi:hypothetical protein